MKYKKLTTQCVKSKKKKNRKQKKKKEIYIEITDDRKVTETYVAEML